MDALHFCCLDLLDNFRYLFWCDALKIEDAGRLCIFLHMKVEPKIAKQLLNFVEVIIWVQEKVLLELDVDQVLFHR